MIGACLLLEFCLMVSGRASLHGDGIFREILESDANLNPGFSLRKFRQAQLKLHNYYRAEHKVPLMKLNRDLTKQAQSYAEELASEDNGLHHCAPPDCDRHGAGENLASKWGSTTVEVNATKLWYDEIWDYNFCNADRRPGHEGKAIGHFTQVVWKTSTKLGIGYARTSDRKKVYVVARYLKHGNVLGRYKQNVLKPAYILKTFQDNCDEIDGGLSDWSVPGNCTRRCGGGVRFKTKTCTDPKPSLNGKDCDGGTKEIASEEWCNVKRCKGKMKYRDEQCKIRGKTPKSYNFGGDRECTLYCYTKNNIYFASGKVNDGTHCKEGSGVCVAGECVDMPKYNE